MFPRAMNPHSHTVSSLLWTLIAFKMLSMAPNSPAFAWLWAKIKMIFMHTYSDLFIYLYNLLSGSPERHIPTCTIRSYPSAFSWPSARTQWHQPSQQHFCSLHLYKRNTNAYKTSFIYFIYLLDGQSRRYQPAASYRRGTAQSKGCSSSVALWSTQQTP